MRLAATPDTSSSTGSPSVACWSDATEKRSQTAAADGVVGVVVVVVAARLGAAPASVIDAADIATTSARAAAVAVVGDRRLTRVGRRARRRDR